MDLKESPHPKPYWFILYSVNFPSVMGPEGYLSCSLVPVKSVGRHALLIYLSIFLVVMMISFLRVLE